MNNKFSFQRRLTSLTAAIETSTVKQVHDISSFVIAQIFPHNGSTVGCPKRISVAGAEHFPRRTTGWIISWAFITFRWTSNCQKIKFGTMDHTFSYCLTLYIKHKRLCFTTCPTPARHGTEYFLCALKCLKMWSYTIWSVWYILSMETKAESAKKISIERFTIERRKSQYQTGIYYPISHLKP